VMALYIAPVSRCKYPKISATLVAVVLFPEAAGPSMAMTIFLKEDMAKGL